MAIEAILLEQPLLAIEDLYDPRYFFFDGKNRGQSTCGIAFETLLGIYRHLDDQSMYLTDTWYQAISVAPNVIVLGYLAEHMCLAAIQRGALQIVDQCLHDPLEKTSFDDVPPVASLIAGNKKRQLYVPSAFNFSDIDAAIVHLDRKALKAHVYLVQVTIAESHKDSEKKFYESHWEKWVKRFQSQDYGVDSTFIWVTREEPSAQDVQEVTRNTRNAGEMVTVYGHHRKHISIKSLDLGLHNAIENARIDICT